MSLEVALSVSRGSFRLDVEFDDRQLAVGADAAAAAGVTIVTGPSGSGKTSLLRAIAGLDRAQGRVVVDGRCWQDATSFLPPHQREVGYVFQEASLFAHLTVEENLRFAFPREEPGSGEWERVIDSLKLGALLGRRTPALSGGERQRVAIGRAFLSRPRLLLMDEPLVGLDFAAREAVLPLLARLCAESRIPVLYVTHSLEEILKIGGRLLLLREGRVVKHESLARLKPQLEQIRELEARTGLIFEA